MTASPSFYYFLSLSRVLADRPAVGSLRSSTSLGYARLFLSRPSLSRYRVRFSARVLPSRSDLAAKSTACLSDERLKGRFAHQQLAMHLCRDGSRGIIRFRRISGRTYRTASRSCLK